MNRGLLSIGLIGLLVAGFVRSQADDTDAAPEVSTITSKSYPSISCTSTDTLASTSTLQLASDARDQLGPLLKLGPDWRFPVHIHIVTPDDPLAAKINREAAAAFAIDYNKGMKIEAALPSSDPDAREFIQRQFVTSLLWEKFFASTKTFDSHTKINAIPIWLIEGLRESLNEDPDHIRESIVRKSVQAQRAPGLDEVTNWLQLSDDRLLGSWQRAFCFYLVDSLTQPGAKRDNFQQWLASLAGANPMSPQSLFPTESGWQHELVDATQRSRDLVYTWDETEAELNAAEVVNVSADKPTDAHVCTIDTIATMPHSPRLVEAAQQKELALTELELRAHTSWHSVLELYRAGLTALAQDPAPSRAAMLLKQARDQRAAEQAYHEKLVDYMNWFQVTKDYAGNVSRFQTYFSTAEQMERMEADPTHPNPIRANLLQVESQL